MRAEDLHAVDVVVRRLGGLTDEFFAALASAVTTTSGRTLTRCALHAVEVVHADGHRAVVQVTTCAEDTDDDVTPGPHGERPEDDPNEPSGSNQRPLDLGDPAARVLTQLATVSQSDLDERVHDALAAEAADLNNQGRAAQLAYLTGVPEAVVRRYLDGQRPDPAAEPETAGWPTATAPS